MSAAAAENHELTQVPDPSQLSSSARHLEERLGPPKRNPIAL